MSNGKLVKIEETYLLIFKIVLLIILTLALVASFGLLIKGGLGLMEQQKIPEPAKTPASLNIKFDDFLNQIEKKEQEKKDKDSNKYYDQTSYDKNEKFIDKTDQVIDSTVDKIWTYFDSYQKNCKVSFQVERVDFIENFQKSTLIDNFKNYGEGYISSLDSFLNDLLSSKRTIDYCIKNEGKGQIFMRAINWHQQLYANWVKETEKFERSEKNRVENFINNEKNRIESIQAKSKERFLYALIAFGIFMSITLLLIISKIEYNLRLSNLNVEQIKNNKK